MNQSKQLKFILFNALLGLIISCSKEEEGSAAETADNGITNEITVEHLALNYYREYPIEELEKMSQRYKAMTFEENQDFIDIRVQLALDEGMAKEDAERVRYDLHAFNERAFAETEKPISALSPEDIVEISGMLNEGKSESLDKPMESQAYSLDQEYELCDSWSNEGGLLNWWDNGYQGIEWPLMYAGKRKLFSDRAYCDPIYISKSYNNYYEAEDIRPLTMAAYNTLVNGSDQVTFEVMAKETLVVPTYAVGFEFFMFTEAINLHYPLYVDRGADRERAFAEDIKLTLTIR
ncbi:MAG: hypothetical protein AAGF77_01135 [Bacteroidota bacterium]